MTDASYDELNSKKGFVPWYNTHTHTYTNTHKGTKEIKYGGRKILFLGSMPHENYGISFVLVLTKK